MAVKTGPGACASVQSARGRLDLDLLDTKKGAKWVLSATGCV
jgi:hypothetical protein